GPRRGVRLFVGRRAHVHVRTHRSNGTIVRLRVRTLVRLRIWLHVHVRTHARSWTRAGVRFRRARGLIRVRHRAIRLYTWRRRVLRHHLARYHPLGRTCHRRRAAANEYALSRRLDRRTIAHHVRRRGFVHRHDYRAPADRARARERVVRNRRHRAGDVLIAVVDVRDVHVRHVDVGNVHVGDVDIANVPVARAIRGTIDFARSEREPRRTTARTPACRDCEVRPAHERDECWRVHGPANDYARRPHPAGAHVRPPSVVEWR